MTRTITAHFDGRVLVPDEPIELPVGQSLRVSVETVDSVADPFSDLRSLAVDMPGVPEDLAAQHDHYLYGNPKR